MLQANGLRPEQRGVGSARIQLIVQDTREAVHAFPAIVRMVREDGDTHGSAIAISRGCKEIRSDAFGFENARSLSVAKHFWHRAERVWHPRRMTFWNEEGSCQSEFTVWKYRGSCPFAFFSLCSPCSHTA